MNDINEGFPIEHERRLYDDAQLERYVDGGYQPLPEHEIVANDANFNIQTINSILPSEMTYSYWNHRQMFEDVNRAEWSKPKNVLSRCARDLWHSAEYYLGIGSRAEVMAQGHDKGPCLIIGSGCSLDDALPYLHRWKGGIICSTSHAATLTYYGATPTHLVGFDTRTAEHEFDFPKNYKKTAFITWPGIHPAVNSGWHGRKLYYRVYDPAVNFYAYGLPAGYNFITTQLQPFGHSVAMQMACANWLGYSPLIMVGTDFCYREKCRFDAWWWRKEGHRRKWTFAPATPTKELNKLHVLIKTAGGQIADYILTHYRRTTVAMSWLDNDTLIDTSTGLLNGIYPQYDIADIIDTQGRCILPAPPVRERVEPWLATENTYFVPMLGGHKLVTAKSDVHLEATLHMLKGYDEDVDIPTVKARLLALREKGEAMRKAGEYGTAGLRE